MRKLSCFGFEIGDQDIVEPVVTSPSRISMSTSPPEYATIATLHCVVNTADVEGFWCKNNNLFLGSYPVQSGLILACENIRFSSLFAAGDVSRFGSSPYITLSNTRKRYLGVCNGRDFTSWSIWKAIGRFVFKMLQMLLIKCFEQGHLMRHCRI